MDNTLSTEIIIGLLKRFRIFLEKNVEIRICNLIVFGLGIKNVINEISNCR